MSVFVSAAVHNADVDNTAVLWSLGKPRISLSSEVAWSSPTGNENDRRRCRLRAIFIIIRRARIDTIRHLARVTYVSIEHNGDDGAPLYGV